MDNNQTSTSDNKEPQTSEQAAGDSVVNPEENKNENSPQGQQSASEPDTKTEDNVTVTNIVGADSENTPADSNSKKEDEKPLEQAEDSKKENEPPQDRSDENKTEQQMNPIQDSSPEQTTTAVAQDHHALPSVEHTAVNPVKQKQEVKSMESVIPAPVTAPGGPVRPPVPPSGGNIPPRSVPGLVQPSHNHAIYFLVSVITLIVGLVFGYLIHLTMSQSSHDQTSSPMMAEQQALLLPADVQKVSACVPNKGALYTDPQVTNGPTYIVYKGKVIGLEYAVPQTSLKTGSLDYLAGNNMKVDHIVVSEQLPQTGEMGDTNDIVDLYSISRTTQMGITCPQMTPAVSVQPTVPGSASAQPTQGTDITPSAGGGTVNPGGVMIPAESTPAVTSSPTVAPAP